METLKITRHLTALVASSVFGQATSSTPPRFEIMLVSPAQGNVEHPFGFSVACLADEQTPGCSPEELQLLHFELPDGQSLVVKRKLGKSVVILSAHDCSPIHQHVVDVSFAASAVVESKQLFTKQVCLEVPIDAGSAQSPLRSRASSLIQALFFKIVNDTKSGVERTSFSRLALKVQSGVSQSWLSDRTHLDNLQKLSVFRSTLPVSNTQITVICSQILECVELFLVVYGDQIVHVATLITPSMILEDRDLNSYTDHSPHWTAIGLDVASSLNFFPDVKIYGIASRTQEEDGA
ncbi:hypothetical protein JNK13_11320 [bacterium]|nr:hypothetical protein [bacterium]